MRKLVFALALVFAGTTMVLGQSVSEYMTMRKQYKITQSVPSDVLENFVGSKVFEIKGVVKGVLKVGGRFTIMIERTDGGTEFVDASECAAWLQGTDVAARLIVKATRENDAAPLKAILLGAAPEDAVKGLDVAPAAKTSKSTPAAKSSGSKPTPSPLTGQIGRGSSKSSRGSSKRNAPHMVPIPVSDAQPLYASFIKNHNPRLSAAEANDIARAVIGYCLKYGVDARLIMAVLMTESDFKPSTVSRAGAMGLGQLMPENLEELGLTDAFDTYQNLYGTVRLIRGHLEDYADKGPERQLVLALAAYNAGPGNVRKYGGVPPFRETQNYVKRVISRYRKLCGLD
ncbi:MAG: lytic transglycosylase domain-containing protein [Armatimonadetes bacterium]|nr:lytic transglycosylase domain-containing protein [Armatimonadota bacterium]